MTHVNNDKRVFEPRRFVTYKVREAYMPDGSQHSEILLDGMWWKLTQGPRPKTFYLSDPCPPDDANTIEIDDYS